MEEFYGERADEEREKIQPKNNSKTKKETITVYFSRYFF